jgi:hypothetical protein
MRQPEREESSMSLETEVREAIENAARQATLTAGDGTIGTLGRPSTEDRLRALEGTVGGIVKAVQMIAREIDDAGANP